MRLSEPLSALKARAEHQLEALDTRDKTKNALLLPFFDVLGYDPFDVREVEPGYAVELGDGETVRSDYAIRVDGRPAMLFQCEEAGTDLDSLDSPSILRGVEASVADVVAVTNGRRYQFYAALEERTGGARRPFLEFDLSEYESGLDQESESVRFLRRLTKSEFNAEAVHSAAFELQYTRRLQSYFAQQQETLDQHFVRFLAAQVYEGEVSEDVLEKFRPVVRTSLQQLDVQTNKEPARDLAQNGHSEVLDEEQREETVSDLAENTPAEPDDGASEQSMHQQEPAESSNVPEEQQSESNQAASEQATEEDEGAEDAGGNVGEEFAKKVIGDF